MSTSIERVRAYLDTLEADRRAALALSEQKAEEARLIKARQEGFRAAMDMLGGGVPVDNAGADPEEHVHRRARRQQKAEEARLIKARQEGFRAAMDMLGGGVPVDNAGADPEEHVHRRARR